MLNKKIVIIILILVTINGCIITRLLQFKHQLKTPIKYIDYNEIGTIKFKKPTLHLSDIELLTSLTYTEVNTNHEFKTAYSLFNLFFSFCFL